MARTTPNQASSSTTTTYQHSGAAQHPLPPQSVATTILKRHTSHQRQRFDSADHALCKQLQAAVAVAATASPQRNGRQGASREAQEPEPEADHSAVKPPPPSRVVVNTSSSNGAYASNGTGGHAYPQQRVRRIRLQRFDSADWVMEAQLSRAGFQSAPTTQSAVAKLILDRHAYTTCHFMMTPVEQQQ